MMKFNGVLIILLLSSGMLFAQNDYEREHRIRKSQFPTLQNDLLLIGQNTKQIRYYKEVDSLEITFFLKFKKDRLNYLLSYNESGQLKESGFRIHEIDIPEDTFSKIDAYLSHTFEKTRIKRIFQLYPVTNSQSTKSVLNNTFQNLILPTNIYRLIIVGKKDNKNIENDLWFDAAGNFIRKRQALPLNHDRILY
jgi:hypothetical protein